MKDTAVILTLKLTNRTMAAAGDGNDDLTLTGPHHARQDITEPNMVGRAVLN
jgi:hypothetical protein